MPVEEGNNLLLVGAPIVALVAGLGTLGSEQGRRVGSVRIVAPHALARPECRVDVRLVQPYRSRLVALEAQLVPVLLHEQLGDDPVAGIDQLRAQVETLSGLSAHADRGELMKWLGTAKPLPKQIHLIHGEPEATQALADLIKERTSMEAHIPQYKEKVEI